MTANIVAFFISAFSVPMKYKFLRYILALRSSYCTQLILMNTNTLEYTDITLRCSNNGNQLGVLKWTQTNPQMIGSMTIQNGMCSVVGSLTDSSKYSFDCSDGTIYLLTIKKITQDMNGKIWTCGGFGSNTLSNEVTIYVIVPVKSSTIASYKQPLTVSENEKISLQCTTSPCRPEPKFIWYISKNGNDVILSQFVDVDASAPTIQTFTNSFDITMTRELNGWYLFCAAGNYNSGLVSSDKILLNITYPPDGPPTINNIQNGSEVKVHQNDLVQLQCSVTGGNPLPRLEWNMFNELPPTTQGNTITKNISWQATGQNPVEFKCLSYHPEKDDSVFVTVNIMYPPETPLITVKTTSGSYVQVNRTLDVIEGIPYTVNCSAKSNPQVSLFRWNDLPPSSSSILFVDKADHGHAESVSCIVSNVMQISDTRPVVIGMNITQLKVNVLYPPKVNILRDTTVIEGEELDYTCYFTHGNPSATNITWNWKGILWDGQHLQLRNVSRNQAGIYRCSVHNIMVASDGSRELGNSNKTFSLSIQYKTNIVKFFVNNHEWNQVTFSENETVNISCEVEGDPFPTGELLHQKACCKEHELPQTFTASQQSSNLRLSSVFRAQCSDTGVQTCTGSNTFNNGWQSASNKSISLFVNCSPRKYPTFEVKNNVTSPLYVTATFHFTAIAYPSPNFQWYRIFNGAETSEAIEGITKNISISTNVMYINFTLEYVQESHYGEYLLNLTNQYGTFQQRFNLIPEELQLTEPQTKSKMFGPAVGGAVGGLLAVITVIVSLVIVRKRKTSKRTSAQSKASDLNDLHTYQNFQNDGQSSSESSNSAVYERLHHADNTEPDQQYQQLATFTETDAPNQKLYENLKLSQLNKENNVGESSGPSQNTSAHNQRPV